jgi:hypothetical protein
MINTSYRDAETNKIVYEIDEDHLKEILDAEYERGAKEGREEMFRMFNKITFKQDISKLLKEVGNEED